MIERGLQGVRVVTSDDHEAIKEAVKVELPQAAWQRCVGHFERNILAQVPQAETKAVAVLERGLEEALTFTLFPSSHQKYLRTTNGNERCAENLASVVMPRVSKDWTLRRRLSMAPLEALFH